MLTVLVTEAGGPAAIGLIKSLKSTTSDIKIVGTDINPLASGIHMADHGATVSHASEVGYIDELLFLIKEHQVDLIIPTGEHDLHKLSKNRERIENLGCKIFVSDQEVVDVCQDKFKFYKHLKQTSVPLPLTFSKDMILKPKRGSGSRGIKVIKSQDCIIQEYLSGKEYTVDVFCDMSSKMVGHVIRERVATKAGISTISKVVQNRNISSIIETVIEHLPIKGPACIQLKEDENGNPHVIECNPRLGGGTYVSTLAGVNCADIYINMLLNKPNTKQKPKKIVVTRYFEEIVV